MFCLRPDLIPQLCKVDGGPMASVILEVQYVVNVHKV